MTPINNWHERHYSGKGNKNPSNLRDELPDGCLRRFEIKQEEPEVNISRISTIEIRSSCVSKEDKRPRANVRSLRKPKPIVLPSATQPQKRPSLSEQLLRIGNGAAAITENLLEQNNEFSGIKPTLVVTSKGFVVGKLRSRFPSPVQVYPDRCEYIFHHPYENSQIKMIMKYGDMRQKEFSKNKRLFQFKIDHDLCQYIGDYNYNNKTHFIKLELNSEYDLTRLRDIINR
mmetsp:Transcript_14425/g.17821  ORF Transcript_14425/g.17821 Transcript_14425/m.17821 type:complete len:230 (-) Transcript_14425:411-1100(-)